MNNMLPHHQFTNKISNQS